MLIPDNVSPDNCIYSNAAYVLEALLNHGAMTTADLYCSVCASHKMTYSLFALCLDWLFLIDSITIENEVIKLCS